MMSDSHKIMPRQQVEKFENQDNNHNVNTNSIINNDDKFSNHATINEKIVPGIKKNAFVHKLYTMLSDKNLSNLIWWNEDNEFKNTFSLLPGKEFSKILTNYFKHGNVASFVRQLHMYGFHKVNDSSHQANYHINNSINNSNNSNNSNSNSDDQNNENQIWEFKHSSGKFRKDDEESLIYIKRRSSSNSNKSSEKQQQQQQHQHQNHHQNQHHLHHQQQLQHHQQVQQLHHGQPIPGHPPQNGIVMDNNVYYPMYYYNDYVVPMNVPYMYQNQLHPGQHPHPHSHPHPHPHQYPGQPPNPGQPPIPAPQAVQMLPIHQLPYQMIGRSPLHSSQSPSNSPNPGTIQSNSNSNSNVNSNANSVTISQEENKKSDPSPRIGSPSSTTPVTTPNPNSHIWNNHRLSNTSPTTIIHRPSNTSPTTIINHPIPTSNGNDSVSGNTSGSGNVNVNGTGNIQNYNPLQFRKIWTSPDQSIKPRNPSLLFDPLAPVPKNQIKREEIKERDENELAGPNSLHNFQLKSKEIPRSVPVNNTTTNTVSATNTGNVIGGSIPINETASVVTTTGNSATSSSGPLPPVSNSISNNTIPAPVGRSITSTGSIGSISGSTNNFRPSLIEMYKFQDSISTNNSIFSNSSSISSNSSNRDNSIISIEKFNRFGSNSLINANPPLPIPIPINSNSNSNSNSQSQLSGSIGSNPNLSSTNNSGNTNSNSNNNQNLNTSSNPITISGFKVKSLTPPPRSLSIKNSPIIRSQSSNSERNSSKVSITSLLDNTEDYKRRKLSEN